jgi:uncharacterized Zn finger protein
MISRQTANSIEVVSFTNGPDTTYTINIDYISNAMQSCTCPDFFQHGHNCKHMYLINRIEGIAHKPLSSTEQSSTNMQANTMTNQDTLFDEAVER